MRHRFLRAALAAVLCVAAAAAYADVRPISAAEREAVRIAAGYLADGPAAIIPLLTPASPLRQTKDLAAEIEARLGPPSGAEWTLETVVPALGDKTAVFTIGYPSGIDETVTFELEPGTHRIHDIRILAQRSKQAAFFATASAAAAAPVLSASSRAAIALGLFALLVACTSVLLLRRSRLVARGVLAAAVMIVIGAAAYSLPRDERFLIRPNAAPKRVDRYPDSLAPLLPLRRAMAATGDLTAEWRKAPRRGTASEIAILWRAQTDLQDMKTEDVKRALRRVRLPSEIPLAAIIRARLALYENDDVSSVLAYEQAVTLGPGRDGLWYEAAEALMALGFDERATGYLRRLAKIGSRDANVYYALSLIEASKRREADAAISLRKAWAMRPVEREDIVATTPFWSLLRDQAVARMVNLSAPAESSFATPCATQSPIQLPAGAEPRVSGEFLHIRIGEQELLVPGGTCIAPLATPSVDAGQWARDDEDHALRDLPQLLTSAHNAAAFAQPALRERLTNTTHALARRNRWTELAQLTDALTPRAEHIAPEIFFLRDTALRRLGRIDESKRLLADLAISRVLQRKNDAQALEELAEKLASLDYFDASIKMYDRAQTIRENPYTDDRVRQIQMNKRLATRYSTQTTPYFEIHFPEDVQAASAETIGKILELEHRRLQKWTGAPLQSRVVVNVVWWEDFRKTYTGSDFILGFYTGKITVPFAGVREFNPFVVSILSHELLHAMLAQATNDQAPRWFQEGLAQRIEMKEHATNAYRIYEEEKLIALSLLDATMRGSPEPAIVAEAYAQSETAVHFIEAKYGTAGIAKMMAAFRDGLTTEQAISRLTGKSVADFDGALRLWARNIDVLQTVPPVMLIEDAQSPIRWSRAPRGDSR
jgi:tetratricopeptide (TPR) repeat protein